MGKDARKKLIEVILDKMEVDEPDEAVRRITSGEWKITERGWKKDNEGIVYIDLPAVSYDPSFWRQIFYLSVAARAILSYEIFEGKGINNKENKIAIIPGSFFPAEKDRTLKNLKKEMDRRGWMHSTNEVSPEIACLLRDRFSNQDILDMGFFNLAVMHPPIKLRRHNRPRLLGLGRREDRLLNTTTEYELLDDDTGYVCIVSQSQLL